MATPILIQCVSNTACHTAALYEGWDGGGWGKGEGRERGEKRNGGVNQWGIENGQ